MCCVFHIKDLFLNKKKTKYCRHFFEAKYKKTLFQGPVNVNLSDRLACLIHNDTLRNFA